MKKKKEFILGSSDITKEEKKKIAQKTHYYEEELQKTKDGDFHKLWVRGHLNDQKSQTKVIRYQLKKDLPGVEKGTILIENYYYPGCYSIPSESTEKGSTYCFSEELMEKYPDWFVKVWDLKYSVD